jgi:hypothetical protein
VQGGMRLARAIRLRFWRRTSAWYWKVSSPASVATGASVSAALVARRRAAKGRPEPRARDADATFMGRIAGAATVAQRRTEAAMGLVAAATFLPVSCMADLLPRASESICMHAGPAG